MSLVDSAVPTGLNNLVPTANPPINRWAIIKRPYGTKMVRYIAPYLTAYFVPTANPPMNRWAIIKYTYGTVRSKKRE